MRVYSNFQKAIREAIKQRYAEGNPKLIREDVANIAKSFGKSAEEATATLADMETQIRNNFLDNSTRKEERIKPTLFSQIKAIGEPVQQAVDRGIRNKADQEELTKIVERTSNLAAYQARTIGRTAAMGKARGEYLLTHLRNGCRYFRYVSTSSHPATPPRAFCQAHTGEVIHINEINKMNNGQGLPVIFYMGGYNCTHTWEAVYGEVDDNVFVTEQWKRKFGVASDNVGAGRNNRSEKQVMDDEIKLAKLLVKTDPNYKALMAPFKNLRGDKSKNINNGHIDMQIDGIHFEYKQPMERNHTATGIWRMINSKGGIANRQSDHYIIQLMKDISEPERVKLLNRISNAVKSHNIKEFQVLLIHNYDNNVRIEKLWST